MIASGDQLICYYDSRGQWLDRASVSGLDRTAISELAYLLPSEEQVLTTFDEISAALASFDVEARLIEANDFGGISSAIEGTGSDSIFLNMTDGFYPVTASYLPALAAMTRKRYFGNSAALQLSIQNKFVQYLMCRRLGIPIPNTALYDGNRYLGGDDRRDKSYRYFVKPFDLANSIGIFADAVCVSLEEAISVAERIRSHYGSKSLIQEYISGESVRVNYVAVNRKGPIHEALGIHLMRGPPDDEQDFTDYETHLREFEAADAAYERMATATSLAPPNSAPHAAVCGIRSDTKKLVECFGLRDFFSMDYKISSRGERYFIELNTLPFARNAGLRAYCKEAFGLTVGGALGSAILSMLSEPRYPQREW